MKFQVDGKVKTLIARQWQPNTSYEDCPDGTEELLSEFLSAYKKDFLRRYKVSGKEFERLAELVNLHNENTALHCRLSAAELDAYDQWDLTRCMDSVEKMTKKENDFLKKLTTSN